jgi:hypothetical protein
MPKRYCVLAASLVFFIASFYSDSARCCGVDGVGTAKRALPATVTAPAGRAVSPDSQPAAQPQPATTGGAAATSDDAGGNLGDGVGGAVQTHRRGLRWQSFLPGVIK